jgi:hypothetical protein
MAHKGQSKIEYPFRNARGIHQLAYQNVKGNGRKGTTIQRFDHGLRENHQIRTLNQEKSHGGKEKGDSDGTPEGQKS